LTGDRGAPGLQELEEPLQVGLAQAPGVGGHVVAAGEDAGLQLSPTETEADPVEDRSAHAALSSHLVAVLAALVEEEARASATGPRSAPTTAAERGLASKRGDQGARFPSQPKPAMITKR